MVSLTEKIRKSDKIDPQNITREQIRKENGLYIVEYGPIMINGKGIKEIQLIKGNVFTDIKMNYPPEQSSGVSF